MLEFLRGVIPPVIIAECVCWQIVVRYVAAAAAVGQHMVCLPSALDRTTADVASASSLRQNLATLADPTATPTYDPLESVEVLVVEDDDGWRAIYFDSATSLAPKLTLADDRGLAGAGFWAIGYERGQPDYTRLIETFRAGTIRSTPIEPRPSAGAP